MKKRYFIILSLCLVFRATLLSAADPASSDGTAALRVALRSKALELQTAQSELATLQASQGALADESKATGAKYEMLKKQIAADRTTTDKATAALTAQATEQKQLIARLTAALEKTKGEGEKAAQAAHAAEAQGEKLKSEKIVLERRAADREAKNLALFLVANEILSRYEEFSLGNAIRAKEPFVGLTRTKLENLVQDYQDKIQEQRMRP